MHSYTPCVVVSALLALTGCNQDEPAVAAFPEGLKEVWGEMFAPYGLQPLFPVRTGIQPGDVFIQCKRPKDLQDRVVATLRKSGLPADETDKPDEFEWRQLFTLDTAPAEMAAHASTRMNYHAFPAPVGASGPAGAASGAAPFGTGNGGSIAGFASFPAVLSYTQKRTDAGLGAAVGVAALGVGSSRSVFSNYLLEIPAAEYAALPYASLQKALLDAVKNLEVVHVMRQTVTSVAEAIEKGQCRAGSLSVVGEAYYARRITVTMADSQASALSARAAYQLPADSTRAAVFQALGSYATGASAPAGAASSAFPSDSARFAKLMLDIDSVYKAADDNSKLGFTGVKLGFAKSSGKGVSMDYSYAHPVAFGVRLYPLDIKGTGGDATLNPGLRLVASLPSDKPLISETGATLGKPNPAAAPAGASAPSK